MSVEAKRGCGYRKVDGLYMMCLGKPALCDRLPYELTYCPCCGSGIQFSRNTQWIDWEAFAGEHVWVNEEDVGGDSCTCDQLCPVCNPREKEKQALMWVGKKHYSPESFAREANQMGISKRIANLPKDFEPGKTLVFFAHKKCITKGEEDEMAPGVFMAAKFTRFEYLVKQSDYDLFMEYQESGKYGDRFKLEYLKKLKNLVKKGVKLVPVPDEDEDHQ